VENIGILGGTFDPIHLGHTEPVKQLMSCLSLNKVLLIPANIPPHKTSPNVTAKQRADMVKLVCNEEEYFYCDNRELARSGHSYTVDTLTELKQCYPKQRLFFIMGLDSLLTFTTWHKYQQILSLCHVVVNTRPNYQLNSVNEATRQLLNQHKITRLAELEQKACGGILIIPEIIELLTQHNATAPIKPLININISSSEIRHRLASKQNCDQFLNAKVCAFINKNRLYR
jgi:nicotinate-nucleotide adenylyltransferase